MEEKKNLYEGFIDALCHKTGFGKIRHQQKVLLAKGAYLNEKIAYELKRNKKEIFALKVIEPHENRVNSFCSHFDHCNGCSLSGMPVSAQEAFKQEIVQNLFSEHANKVESIVSNPKPYHYRNKVELTFSQNLKGEKHLGFMRFDAKGAAFSLKECKLIPEWMVQAAIVTEKLFIEHPIEAFYLPKMRGDLKTLVLRSDDQSSHLLLALTVQDIEAIPKDFINGWQKAISLAFANKRLSFYLIEQKVEKGKPTTIKEVHLSQELSFTQSFDVVIHQKSYKMHFDVTPLSFFQPNPIAAKQIYSLAIENLELSYQEVVLDLYCGVGTFGMIAANLAKKVIGIEIIPQAIEIGKKTAIKNKINNIELIAGDVKDKISQFIHEGVSKIIVDPPRAGLDSSVIQAILQISPQKIVYISCNPHTQINDCKSLIAAGYLIEKIIPVDQFTHTPHLENIVVLKKS